MGIAFPFIVAHYLFFIAIILWTCIDTNTDISCIRIPGDFRSLIYFYGVHDGGVEEWEHVFERYRNNKIASEKTKLMYALAATKEPWLLDRYV